MTVFEIVKKLAKSRSKTMKQVTSDLGYSENYFYSLKSGKQPTAEKLNEIANYFGVSTDYLLGRTEDEFGASEMSGSGSDLVGYFRINTANMPPEDAEGIEEELKEYMAYLVSKVEEKNKKIKKDDKNVPTPKS